MPVEIPTSDVLIVVDSITGVQLAHVINPTPALIASLPKTSSKLYVDKESYKTMTTPKELDDHIISKAEELSFPVPIVPIIKTDGMVIQPAAIDDVDGGVA